MPLPIEVLGAMITPAVLISAAALLVLSTAARLGRANDRLLHLTRDAEKLYNPNASAPAHPRQRQHIEDQLGGLAERLTLLRSAMNGMYVTIALFICTSIALGLYAAFPALTSLVPNSIGMLGAVAFLYSIVLLILEGSSAYRITQRDLDHAKSLLR
jgi:hypothetical protein